MTCYRCHASWYSGSVRMYNTPSPPCCPVRCTYSNNLSSSLIWYKTFPTQIFSAHLYWEQKSKKSRLPRLNPSAARQLSLSVWEKAVMKKALNAILFIAAAWALNTGTHSFEEAEGEREGGGTLAKWIHLCEPEITNTSFSKNPNLTETTTNLWFSVIRSFHALTALVNKFVSARLHIMGALCRRRRFARISATARLTRC